MRNLFIRLAALLLAFALTCCSAAAEPLEPLARPELPDMAPYPVGDSGFPEDDAAYDAWRASLLAQRRDPSCMEGLTPFFTASTRQILAEADGSNRVYSPLSLYMALAMLAETTGGETRLELLQLLGAGDIARLRQQAADLWNANYRRDGTMTRTLSTALWLNENLPYSPDTLSALSQHYYASAYRGRPGDPAYDAALRAWLNEATSGLLQQQTASVSLPPDAVLALTTAVSFQARWADTFSPDAVEERVFHAPSGDAIHPFMQESGIDTAYFAEGFTAVCKRFDQEGAMWFLLPDEGMTPESLLADDAALSFLLDASVRSSWRDQRTVRLTLRVPKFDASALLELSSALRSLGITSAFDPDLADFSPLTDASPVFLTQARHDARVKIDEEGCEAAAYTLLLMCGAGLPPEDLPVLEMTLDRPFLFTVTGANGLPLFVGIVHQP